MFFGSIYSSLLSNKNWHCLSQMCFQTLPRFNCFLQNRFSGKYISRFQNWSLFLRIEIEHSHRIEDSHRIEHSHRIEFSFRNRRFVSKLLFQFKVKLLHPELKFCFRNQSFFFRNRSSNSRNKSSQLSCNNMLETKLWTWIFSKLGRKFQFQERRFDSVSKVSFWKINFNSVNEGYIYLRNKWPY